MKLIQSMLSTVKLALSLTVPLAVALPAHPPTALQNIVANTHGSVDYGYPTDLTRDIEPIPMHSHNDYWRDVPFYSALSTGCISIEADVFLRGEKLLVGHKLHELTLNRTLDTLYIQPLLEVLNRQNPDTDFSSSNETKNGVFDFDPEQTLYLWIDVKSDGHKTFPSVVEALRPLRDANYLTKYNGQTVTPGPVTVIGTGHTPLDLVEPVRIRDYFWDAPVAKLREERFSHITKEISPMASGNFRAQISDGKIGAKGIFNRGALRKIRDQVQYARSKGIGVRYWGLPGWPVGARNTVWKTLLDNGVSLISVDNLKAALGFEDV